jgi:hypothetical protein
VKIPHILRKIFENMAAKSGSLPLKVGEFTIMYDLVTYDVVDDKEQMIRNIYLKSEVEILRIKCYSKNISLHKNFGLKSGQAD